MLSIKSLPLAILPHTDLKPLSFPRSLTQYLYYVKHRGDYDLERRFRRCVGTSYSFVSAKLTYEKTRRFTIAWDFKADRFMEMKMNTSNTGTQTELTLWGGGGISF